MGPFSRQDTILTVPRNGGHFHTPLGPMLRQPAIHVIPRDRAVGTYTPCRVARLWQCFFSLRAGWVTLLSSPCAQPPSALRGRRGVIVRSVPDVLGWFGRFFYLAFSFCTASLGMRVTAGRGAGRLCGLEGVTPYRHCWLDENCEIPLMMMRRGDAGDDILVLAGRTV